LDRHFREEGPRCLTYYCILRSRVVEAALETSLRPVAMAYLAPIHRPSSVRHALKLNLLDPEEECLVLA
jgi:hypothetical protein